MTFVLCNYAFLFSPFFPSSFWRPREREREFDQVKLIREDEEENERGLYYLSCALTNCLTSQYFEEEEENEINPTD